MATHSSFLLVEAFVLLRELCWTCLNESRRDMANKMERKQRYHSSGEIDAAQGELFVRSVLHLSPEMIVSSREMIIQPPVAGGTPWPHLQSLTSELSRIIVREPTGHRCRLSRLKFTQEIQFWATPAPPSDCADQRYQVEGLVCFLIACLDVGSSGSKYLGRNSTRRSSQSLSLTLTLILTLVQSGREKPTGNLEIVSPPPTPHPKKRGIRTLQEYSWHRFHHHPHHEGRDRAVVDTTRVIEDVYTSTGMRKKWNTSRNEHISIILIRVAF